MNACFDDSFFLLSDLKFEILGTAHWRNGSLMSVGRGLILRCWVLVLGSSLRYPSWRVESITRAHWESAGVLWSMYISEILDLKMKLSWMTRLDSWLVLHSKFLLDSCFVLLLLPMAVLWALFSHHRLLDQVTVFVPQPVRVSAFTSAAYIFFLLRFRGNKSQILRTKTLWTFEVRKTQVADFLQS